MKLQGSHRSFRQALFPVCAVCETTIDKDFPDVGKAQVSVGNPTRMKLCSEPLMSSAFQFSPVHVVGGKEE